MNPPPSGLEPTPDDGLPTIVCPHCGRDLPPIAPAAKQHAAQVPSATARLNRARELEDATPTVAHPVNPRLAETDRLHPP